jgi:hypothetical protein
VVHVCASVQIGGKEAELWRRRGRRPHRSLSVHGRRLPLSRPTPMSPREARRIPRAGACRGGRAVRHRVKTTQCTRSSRTRYAPHAADWRRLPCAAASNLDAAGQAPCRLQQLSCAAAMVSPLGGSGFDPARPGRRKGFFTPLCGGDDDPSWHGWR